jgi:hypothetical protein
MNDYNQWLELSVSAREQMAETWDVYKREGFKIGLMALARLCIESTVAVMDAQVGVGHGGRWILHVTCDQDAQMLSDTCPQEFEGFDVLWLQMGPGGSPLQVF